MRWLTSLLVALPLPLQAAEGEQAISVAAGYANLTLPQSPPGQQEHDVSMSGGMLELEYERALNDTFWFRAGASGGIYDGPSATSFSAASTVGLLYRFDVVRYVPYFHGGLGGVVGTEGGLETTWKPVMELGGGLDVLESRNFSWGVALKWDAFASQARYLTVGARVSWRWGFF